MMKIALCKSHFAGPVSGADEALVTYAARLHRAGYAVTVVLLYPPSPNDQYHRRLRQAGIDVACVVDRSVVYALMRASRELLQSLFFFLYLIPSSTAKMRKAWQTVLQWVSYVYAGRCRVYFAERRPDLLHVFTPDVGAGLMIRAGHELKIPVLYQELGTPHYMPELDVYYYRLAKVLPLCSEVAALSPLLAEQWVSKFPFLHSLSVLPLIVEDCSEKASTEGRQSPSVEAVFGYAARMEEGKGPLVLLDAFAELNEAQPTTHLRMAGTGPQLAQVKLHAKKLRLLDSCEFTGTYTEALGRNAFMRSLDVFVLPTRAEGTPNSIIEAMAHGLPVIASAVGGIPDMLSPEVGILVAPGDGKALAQAMQRLARDPVLRARMGRAARERYLKLFSPEAVLPILGSTYQRLAGNGASRRAAAANTNGSPHPWQAVPQTY